MESIAFGSSTGTLRRSRNGIATMKLKPCPEGRSQWAWPRTAKRERQP